MEVFSVPPEITHEHTQPFECTHILIHSWTRHTHSITLLLTQSLTHLLARKNTHIRSRNLSFHNSHIHTFTHSRAHPL